MIEFPCPTCGLFMRVNDSLAGRAGKCPKCGEKLKVPGFLAPQIDESPAVLLKTRERSRRPIVLVVCIGLAATLTATVFGLFAFFNRSSPKTPDGETAVAELERKGEKRVEPLPGSVAGGAWLVRAGGSSEVIRGLEVYVLKPWIEKKHISALLDLTENQTTMLLEHWKQAPSDLKHGANFAKAHLGLLADGDAAIKTIREYKSLPDNSTIELDRVWKVLRSGDALTKQFEEAAPFPANIELNRRFRIKALVADGGWPAVVAQTRVSGGATGIDGKYHFDGVRPGKYFLYARHYPGDFFIEWLLPLEIHPSSQTSQDLSNQNASLLVTKTP